MARIGSAKMAYLILVALMMIIQQGMTVPGAKHNLEAGQEEESATSQQIRRYRHNRKNGGNGQKFAGLYTGPYFDPSMPNNVSVQLGDTALLICKVNQVGGKTVSWIRKRDSHILTVDGTTFISDERFYILKPERRHVWTLRIRYVQPRDAGIYECQVSTEPKMSHFVQLNIIEPTVTIEANDGRVHAHQGSDVEFKCLIRGMLQKPAYVFWYHGDERLLPEYDPTMSDNVKVVEEPQSSSGSMADSEKTPFFPEETRDYFVDEDFLVDTRSMYLATLKLNRVKPEQKGKYKCGPSNTQSASVELHITDGEIRAAMSEGTSNGSYAHSSIPTFQIFILWFVANIWCRCFRP